MIAATRPQMLRTASPPLTDAARDYAERGIIVGLIGEGIQRSRSPYIHQTEADKQGLRLIYRLLDFSQLKLGVSDLPQVLKAVELAGFAGVNVTHPFKQAIMPLLDKLSPAAEEIGAVNTVVFSSEGRVGHNTDFDGFSQAFRAGLPNAPLADVLQLGAGGAGAATAFAMLKLGADRLSIWSRTKSKSTALAERLARSFGPSRVRVVNDLLEEIPKADGIVHATPVGMAQHPGALFDPQLLNHRQWLAEIVYVPLETELLAGARRRNCATIDGGGMVVIQAAKAFELFTGARPHLNRMLDTFRVRAAS